MKERKKEHTTQQPERTQPLKFSWQQMLKNSYHEQSRSVATPIFYMVYNSNIE